MRSKIIKIFSVSIGMLMIMGAISLIFPVQSSAEKVELTMWWWGEQDNVGMEDYLNSVARKYEEQNPGVTVNLVLQGTDETVPAVQAADAYLRKINPKLRFIQAKAMCRGDPYDYGYTELTGSVVTESKHAYEQVRKSQEG